jgi:hypothetical protein
LGVTQTPYLAVAFVGLSVFGIGLGFFATPAVDTAMTNALMEKAWRSPRRSGPQALRPRPPPPILHGGFATAAGLAFLFAMAVTLIAIVVAIPRHPAVATPDVQPGR